MKFFIKQKLLAIGDDFEVLDEQGNLAYYFDGHVFAIGKKIVVLANNQHEVAVIRRKLFSFRPTFLVKQSGETIARIYKKLFTIRKTIIIDVPGPDDITVVGKVLEHDYVFYRGNKKIAEVSKKWFRGQDSYGVDIELENDALLVLSCAVIIDVLFHPSRDSGFNTKAKN